MKVRQSTLGEADKCLRSLQYSTEHPVYHGGSIRAVGTAYHRGVEEFYLRPDVTADECVAVGVEEFDRCAAMGPSHESEKTKTAGEFRWDDKFPDRASAIEAVEYMLREYLEHYTWPVDPNCAARLGSHPDDGQFGVIGVELGFELPFWNGHTRNGSMDLVLVDHNGGILGVDQKTAGRMWPKDKEHPRKQNQANWYTKALQELFPGAPYYRFVFDIMTYAGKFERRVTDPSPEHIEAVENKALQVVALYEGLRGQGIDMPANPASTLCSPKWCDHWDICDHGAALDH